MEKFEQISNLPMCCRALDGTFMPIVKPEEYCDSYWCYKQYCAIVLFVWCIVLFVWVDRFGLFTFVDAGVQGSFDDAAV